MLLTDKSVAEDFEVAVGELNEVDDDGAVCWRVRMGKCPDMSMVRVQVQVRV